MKDEQVIIFAGDSVTDAGKGSTGDGLGSGYVRLVRNYLCAFCPQQWYKVINAGISGNTTRDLLARWDNDVAAYRPDVTFLLIGVNDVWRHFDRIEKPAYLIEEKEFEENMRALCEKMKGSKAFMLSPYYLERSSVDEMRSMVDRYAAIARKVAGEYGYPYIDVQADFDAYMKSRSGQTISWDRVHPGEIGSMILARAVLRALGV